MENAKLIALIILIIGGLNLGLIGLLNYDLIAVIFGAIPNVVRIINVLVGLSAAYIGALKLMKK